MKELPKVFHNNITKQINNNEKIFYSKDSANEQQIYDNKTVLQKINEIFSSPNYVYKANVDILLNDTTLHKRIIGRNKDFIITMDNKLIPIKDIKDIKCTKK